MSSDYLDKLIGKAKARDFFDDPLAAKYKPTARDQTRAVRRDKLDMHAWDVIRDQVTALDEQIKEGEADHPTIGAAYEDLFNLLNQGDPRFVEQDRMVDQYLPQHGLMQSISAAEDFKYIRKETRYDEYNTALAMMTMKDRLEKSFDQMQDMIDAINEAMQALQDAINNAVAMSGGQGIPQPGEGEAGPGGPSEQDVSDAIDQLLQAMAAAGLAQAQGDEAQEAMRTSMEKAVKEARDKIDAEKETAAGYGLSDGELQRMDYAQRRRLADRLDNKRMERLAKLLGRFRQYADGERRRKITAVPAEKYDVEMGNDLAKIVPSELDHLAMPEVEDLFWLRWAKQGLAQYKVRGIDRAGKGPILVVCDESGSMGAGLDDEGNSREAWSKAVCLSLADQAKRDKRDFTYIGFSSTRQTWEITFEKGVMDHEQVVAFTEHFFGGGTSYEGPIQRAAQIVAEYGDRGKMMPDVVFITDDSCRVSAEFVEWWRTIRDRYDVRCYGLQIGGEPYANQLKDLSDRCLSIDSLNANPEGVVELFQQI